MHRRNVLFALSLCVARSSPLAVLSAAVAAAPSYPCIDEESIPWLTAEAARLASLSPRSTLCYASLTVTLWPLTPFELMSPKGAVIAGCGFVDIAWASLRSSLRRQRETLRAAVGRTDRVRVALDVARRAVSWTAGAACPHLLVLVMRSVSDAEWLDYGARDAVCSTRPTACPLLWAGDDISGHLLLHTFTRCCPKDFLLKQLAPSMVSLPHGASMPTMACLADRRVHSVLKALIDATDGDVRRELAVTALEQVAAPAGISLMSDAPAIRARSRRHDPDADIALVQWLCLRGAKVNRAHAQRASDRVFACDELASYLHSRTI